VHRAPDHGGLGQLEVSALSAALFFGWLRGAGTVAGAPLASCRVHLAPRADEMDAVAARTGGHHGAADHATLRAALDAWGGEMSVPGRTTGDPNVALFFSSGHGVEVAASPAVLASDALTQLAADGGANRAIAVVDMVTAVKTYNVDRVLFFVDACRDAPRVARLLDLVGDQPLRPNRTPARRVDAMIGLQSTASGLSSYQVKDEQGTIFTQAVLDGLNGQPPDYLPYDVSTLPWPLRFAELEGHVKRKVTSLLADKSPLAVQSVDSYGNPYNGAVVVAIKDGPPHDAGDGPPATPASAATGSAAASASLVLRGAKALDAGMINAVRGAGARSASGDLLDYGIMHEVLGHEAVTHPWIETLTFRDAVTGEAADPGVARVYAARSQEIDGRIAAWLDLAVAPGEGERLWIAAGGGDLSPGAAVAIPRDRKHPIPVRLDVQFESCPDGWRLRQMRARLADPAGHGEFPFPWQPLFDAQRSEAFGDLGSAARPIEADYQNLQDVVAGKRLSPVAAAVATNLLLRAGATRMLHDWPRNLANWFPWLADGPVLWAETLLLREGGTSDPRSPQVREALESYVEIAKRGVPLLANSLSIALRQADVWRAMMEADEVPPSLQHALAESLEFVDRAGRYAVSGQGFARFVSGDLEFGPETVLGARRPPQAVAMYA
jgi:hypothetical protein